MPFSMGERPFGTFPVGAIGGWSPTSIPALGWLIPCSSSLEE